MTTGPGRPHGRLSAQLQATARRLLAAMFAFAFGLSGASPASAVTPPYTYDTAAYAYDVPAGLATSHASVGAARGLGGLGFSDSGPS